MAINHGHKVAAFTGGGSQIPNQDFMDREKQHLRNEEKYQSSCPT